MLKVKRPNFCSNEIEYSLDILLGTFLGIDFEVETYTGDKIELLFDGSTEKLTLDISFFNKAKINWLKTASMPILPLLSWIPENDGINANLIEASLPVLYGKPGLVRHENHIHLNIDIFGSVFFMLSRYEELIIQEYDVHERFSAFTSTAYKANFLDRPLVNEYLEILYCCMKMLWPKIKRKEQEGATFVTCDVDWPYQHKKDNLKNIFKNVIRSIIYEKNHMLFVLECYRFVMCLIGKSTEDHYRRKISWIMSQNEKINNVVHFYFIPCCTSKYDSDFDFSSKKMKKLLKEINNRGHQIGIHPGYNTFNSEVNFKKTIMIFKKILKDLEISNNIIGGRQHYLRWNSKLSPQFWDNENITYDSSLGYHDYCGFRCGTCYQFSMYDLINRKKLKLKQIPLIVMEATLINVKYENLRNKKEIINRINQLKNICYRYNGTFTILWHNSNLQTIKNQSIYKKIIK